MLSTFPEELELYTYIYDGAVINPILFFFFLGFLLVWVTMIIVRSFFFSFSRLFCLFVCLFVWITTSLPVSGGTE